MRKLTDSDKQEILKLYRETAETTSTLAERYGVSNSTISRLLKSTLPEEEYEYLVSLKRAARTPEGRAQVSYEQLSPASSQPQIETEPFSSDAEDVPVRETKVRAKSRKESSDTSSDASGERSDRINRHRIELPKVEIQPPEVDEEPDSEQFEQPIPVIRRVKTRSSATEKLKLPAVKELEKELEIVRHKPSEIPSIPRTIIEDEHPAVNVIGDIFDEDLLDESDDLDDLDDDLYEDEDDYEDEDYEDPKPLVTRLRSGEAPVQVLPFSAANLPKTCYLVIDRSAELITRPLKDFGDLGAIPTIETQQRTLPVFDNHRVAKRFSTKRDRVIKVPDSRMLQKASSHLQAKGITRLLIDGQVYSLSLV